MDIFHGELSSFLSRIPAHRSLTAVLPQPLRSASLLC